MENLACDVCKSSFKTKRILKRHKERQDCEKVFSCDDCGKRSKFNLDFYRNHKSYCPGVSYDCTICQKSFKNQNLLDYHQVHHANKREFGCDQCGKRFNVKSDLKIHQRIHTGEKNFYCNDCGKGFLDSSRLRSHKNVHSEERDFLCDCGKSFKTTEALKKHAFVHKDVKDYECYVCEKSFKGEFYLKDHMQIHNNILIPCKDCGKCFKKKAYLTSHIQKRHTKENEKPHQCSLCGKAFVVKSHMNSHIKKQHPESFVEYQKICDQQQEDATVSCVLCNKTTLNQEHLEEHFEREHQVATNSSFLAAASKLFTFESSNMNVVTLIMDEIMQEGQTDSIVVGHQSKKRKSRDEEHDEFVTEKEVKTETEVLKENEGKRKEKITDRVQTKSSVSSTFCERNEKRLDHENLSKKDEREENITVNHVIDLIVDVKVEKIEREMEKEGGGNETTFENQNQNCKKRTKVFGKRFQEMPGSVARVGWGAGVRRVDENNEWKEALDLTSIQVPSPNRISPSPSRMRAKYEKVLPSFPQKIPDQLLKDFQELCSGGSVAITDLNSC